MREMAIAEALLDEVMTLVTERDFTRIDEIEIAVGEAADADPDALGRALEERRANTPAGNAKIRITFEPLRAFCDDCFDTFPVAGETIRCPLCDGDACEIISGRDVMLVGVVGEREQVGAAGN